MTATRRRAIRLSIGELSNRNGFNFIVPVVTRDQFESMDFRSLADAGFDGIAIWFTDAQWGHNSEITDAQWQNRAIIEREFCSRFPNGSRRSENQEAA